MCHARVLLVTQTDKHQDVKKEEPVKKQVNYGFHHQSVSGSKDVSSLIFSHGLS